MPVWIENLIDVKYFIYISLVFVPLELAIPFDKRKNLFRDGLLLDLSYLFINGIFIRVGLGCLIWGIQNASHYVIPQPVQAIVGGQNLVTQILLVFLIGDIGFYVAHRMFHAIPFLWRFHSIHHSIEHLDWIAGHRVHMVDQIMTKGLSFLLPILLGFSPVAIGIWSVIYGWHSILLHSNVRLPFGPIGNVLASPHFHRWHHSSAPEARDRNFAGQLAILDRVFGTLYMPESKPAGYGIGQVLPSNWFGQLVYPFASDKKSRAAAEAATVPSS